MNKYLIRLDDACPTMDRHKWQRTFNILDSYGVRPLVGIIPQNDDPKLMIEPVDPEFWNKAKQWQEKGYSIALHGFNHCYTSKKGLEGLNPLWERSEFSGIPFEIQKQKIRDGIAILNKHGLTPKYFFAPSHTFDRNTLKALKECSNIRIVSDTIATKPYRKDNFVFIPQLGGHCKKMIIHGIWTFCLHPNTMNETNFIALEKFLQNHHSLFIGFEEIQISSLKQKDSFSHLLSWLYFTQRKIRRVR